jgi:RNA polymerase sigma factor (sigma-70 family)
MVSDDPLIHDCKKGKKQAFSLLYKKYASVLLGMCMRYTRNRQEAEDVLQEGFIKIFRKIDTYQGKGSFEGWLKRIMINTAINYYKKNKKFQLQESLDAHHVKQVSNHEEEANVWVER